MKTYLIQAKYKGSRRGWEDITTCNGHTKQEAERKYAYLTWNNSNVERIRAKVCGLDKSFEIHPPSPAPQQEPEPAPEPPAVFDGEGLQYILTDIITCAGGDAGTQTALF